MKKQLLFLLTIILSVSCYAQITFEKGYLIDNSNQKTNCLIKNIDWQDNPTEFEYKLSENSKSKKANIKSIKEFGIDNISKYVRSIVNIDRSSELIDDLTNDRNPEFKEEELFLKVLVEGNANLYLYEDGNLRKYFYNKGNTVIEQLVFKSYKTYDNDIGKNNRFKNQLWNNLKCPNFKITKVENLNYQMNDLVGYFVEFNECFGEKYINYEEKQKRDLFNLNVRVGFNSSSLLLQNKVLSSRDFDLDNEIALRFGIEAEIIMPFNKNKWSLIIEPSYQYYKSEKEISNVSVNADYKSIEFPIGVRHYFFLNENSKIFINGSYNLAFDNNSIIDLSSGIDLEVVNSSTLAFGLGYKHNDKYILEIRYHASREILSRNGSEWFSDYNTLSVIFGYSFF